MKRILSKIWGHLVGGVLALFLALRMFFKFPMLTVSISAIPVSKWVDNKLHLTPVLSKVCFFAIFSLLLWISWSCAEINILLCAIAFMAEGKLLIEKVQNRMNPQLAI